MQICIRNENSRTMWPTFCGTDSTRYAEGACSILAPIILISFIELFKKFVLQWNRTGN